MCATFLDLVFLYVASSLLVFITSMVTTVCCGASGNSGLALAASAVGMVAALVIVVLAERSDY